MKKQALVELVNSKHPQLHHLMVEAWMSLAWNELIYQIYKIEPSNVDFFAKNYHSIAVEKDANNQYYCTLPVQVVQLPDAADGVRRIMYENDGVTTYFLPVPRDSFGVFAELDQVDARPLYSTRHDKVVWDSNPGVDTVSADLVPTLSSYDDEDELSAPMGFDAKFVAIVDQLILGTPPENKINN